MFKPNLNTNNNLVDSILTVKASGHIDDIATMDLLLPQGKSIAQLIDDQEKEKNDQIVE